MWKYLILLLMICGPSIANEHQSHLIELKKEYPHALLTDDFGILNKMDLKINGCIANPVAFSEREDDSPYPYWQCFEVKNSKMICEGRKYDPHEKKLMSLLVVSSERDGERHEFLSRRPLPLKSCQLYEKDWLKFTKDQRHVCISGDKISKKMKGSTPLTSWIFLRYKTRLGCDSYFQGECDGVQTCRLK